MGETGDGFQAEAPREVIPFNPRANDVRETRNGFVRGGNTGIPCAGGTCFHAIPNAQFEGGEGRVTTARGILRVEPENFLSPASALSVARPGPCRGLSAVPGRWAFGGTGDARFAGMPGRLPQNGLEHFSRDVSRLSMKVVELLPATAGAWQAISWPARLESTVAGCAKRGKPPIPTFPSGTSAGIGGLGK